MNEVWRDEVLLALSNACSQNPGLVKEAEKKLENWETQAGFYSLLMFVFRNKSLDVNIRWMAILYIKIGVDRYWRKTATHAISEDEKTFMKQNLMLSFDEPVNQVATQIAVLISKIARTELKDWPELLPTLLKDIQSEDAFHQQRTLLIFNHVIKMLASKRLICDRQLFQQITGDTFGFILQLWQHTTSALMELYQNKDARVLASLELSTLVLKVLRKMVVHGFKVFEPSSQPACLLQAVLEKITIILQYRKAESGNRDLQEKLGKYLLLMTKVLIDTQEHLPLSFSPLIQQSLQLCYTYLFTSQGREDIFETFALQCCKLVKVIVMCDKYKPPREIKDTTPQEVLKAHQAKMAFFTPAVLSEIIHQLVLNYFPLTSEDLEIWDSDPESVVNEEAGESWRFNLRACTEVLYLSLLNEFRSTVTPVVTEMIKLVQGSPPSDEMNVVLQKDAVYNACGLASYHLFDEVDFDQWFVNQLVNELNNSSPSYKVLRRRIIWMTGEWINVKVSRQTRPVVYQVCLKLMNAQEDLVVRLTAANTLKTAIDDVDFNLDDFLQYLDETFGSLFHLLKCTQDCDTKMHILNVLSMVIQCIGNKVRPFASSLSLYLPELWQESENHNMLQCTVVSTVTHLVKGLGVLSQNMYSFLLPLIHISTDITQPPHVYLLEDGLDLWHNVLMNASRITPELLHLFVNLQALLDFGSENLRICFAIIESYVLLDEKEFLQSVSAPVVNSCLSMLGNIKTEDGIILSKVVETVIKVSPLRGTELFAQVLLKIFHMILEVEEYTPLLVIYLCIVGEVILHNYPAFVQIVESVAQQLHKQSTDVLTQLLDVWLDKMDCMTRLERRKLTVLALMTLLPLNANNKCVLDKFAVIVDSAVDVLHEIHRVEEAGIPTDCLVLLGGGTEDEDPNEECTEEYKRRRQMCLTDPVHCCPLWKFVRDKLHECHAIYGQDTFKELMDCVDSAVTTQLGSFINH
ncbi:importin-11-like [Acropora millepora]|uniref:importin-11-like n=1 Tax=Acropora millepora TaxID=45264 RepID=UPI001CF3A95F|nr:importin-11-like [Acropora millepora]